MGGSAGGFIYPVVIVLSGLSKDELPNNDFLVVQIEGLSVNGHIDPMNKEVGYIYFLGSNVPQNHFFDWFYENITYLTVLDIRRRYNPFREESNEVVGEYATEIQAYKALFFRRLDKHCRSFFFYVS